MNEKKTVLPVVRLKGQSQAQAVAVAALSPAINAAVVADAFQGSVFGEDCDLGEQVACLQASMGKVNAGDLAELEGMLIGQATALQSIFVSLARRAQVQSLQKNLEAFLGLALKAQAQSRATISALVDLKYPRQATFVKQANIAHGPQQVNNGAQHIEASSASPSHGEKFPTQSNKLLENVNGEGLDTGAPGEAERGHQTMEALEPVGRPQNRRGKGQERT